MSFTFIHPQPAHAEPELALVFGWGSEMAQEMKRNLEA